MAQSTNLKQWMRAQNIYDKDIEPILAEEGIADPTVDFKTFTQAQWDELYRRAVVARAKELKSAAAKSRLEKKMAKLEKFWRSESGIAKTSIQKGKKKGKKKKKKTPANSAAVNNEALASSKKLKKYLQNNGCFDKDLLIALSNADIHNEDDLTKIDSNAAFDEIKRQVSVARAAELKDNAAKSRMEKNMTKFEKLWRAKTNIKRTAQTKKTKKGKKKKGAKDKATDKLTTGDGKELKKWLRDNNIWEKSLFDELLAHSIKSEEDLHGITEKKFDTIVRKVRVERFSELKDTDARNRADKLLVKFEKIWRKTTGIKKTSIQDDNNDGDEKDGDEDNEENADATTDADDADDAKEEDGGDNNEEEETANDEDNNNDDENGGGDNEAEEEDGGGNDEEDAEEAAEDVANDAQDEDAGGDDEANADEANADNANENDT